jgi:HD superfamily phosphohydrolase
MASPKTRHEIRDPIYGFIYVSADERSIIDSRPVQRLRHVRQLALSSLLYPAATHGRFEHSLGTMYLASRVFDAVTRVDNVTDDVRVQLPMLLDAGHLAYWRQVVRMAGLCHDLGHLPFSHAAESQLLPKGWSHERISWELILGEEMGSLWKEMTPPLRAEDVAKLAIGKKHAPDGVEFSLWEEVLSEIVVGDAFGVDRMDYLLRDSHHAGVEYGRFDYRRLSNSMRILPGSPRDDAAEDEEPPPPALGVEEGGLESARQLLLARYFMFSQMYLHHVRRVYDLHLIEFLTETLDGGVFPVELEEHLRSTDNEVMVKIAEAARDPDAKAHVHADAIYNRRHFKLLYDRTDEEARRNPEVVSHVADRAREELGPEYVLADEPEDAKDPPDFPVLTRNQEVVSSKGAVDLLKDMTVIRRGYVFVSRKVLEDGRRWLSANRADLTKEAAEEDASKPGGEEGETG